MAPRLRSNSRLVGDDGTSYRVGRLLSEGGFGTTYEGHRLSANGAGPQKVCLKVCSERQDWHGEAFFGELLARDKRVVRLQDAFVSVTGTGSGQRRKYVLVFEFMDGGTVWDAVEAGRAGWPEARVRRELKALLRVLTRLHNAGVTHRDLKPNNVYLRGGRLALGDFGISRMALDPRDSRGHGHVPDFSPPEVVEAGRWASADDVYQVGLLAATLLSGEVWWSEVVSGRAIADLPGSGPLKTWIWHATGARAKRYWDAAEARDALDGLADVSVRPGRPPRSLRRRNVAFAGRVPGATREEAARAARRAGARVQDAPSDSTTLLVVGEPRRGAGLPEGTTLFAVRERIRLGQPIALIGPADFRRLARI